MRLFVVRSRGFWLVMTVEKQGLEGKRVLVITDRGRYGNLGGIGYGPQENGKKW